jgi:hypothetical protein
METAECERVHAIFCGLAKQMEKLETIYLWCKVICVCRRSDVPTWCKVGSGVGEDESGERHCASSVRFFLLPRSVRPCAHGKRKKKARANLEENFGFHFF